MNAKAKRWLYCLALAFAFLLIASRSSWLYPLNDWVDSQSYFTMGRGLFAGKVLYKDLFEQKGPYVYFIYGLGSLLSARTFAGVFVFEVLSFTVFLYAAGALIRRLSGSEQRLYYVLPLIAAVTTQSNAFYRGGSAEQMFLPLLMYGLFCITRYHESDAVAFSSRELFLNGFCAGVIFLGKYTLLGVYVGFFLYILIAYQVRRATGRDWKNLWRILAGFAAALAPWLAYFVLTGSLQDFLSIYFVENASVYSPVSRLADGFWSLFAVAWKDIFINTAKLRQRNVCLFWCVYGGLLVGSLSGRSRRWYRNLYPVLLFLLMYAFLFAGGKYYLYYPLPVAVFLPYLFSWKPLPRLAEQWKPLRRYTALILCADIGLSLFWMGDNSINTRYLLQPYKDSAQAKFAKIIDASSDPTLLNLGWLDGGFYAAAGIVPDVRYYQNNNLPRSRCLEYQIGYVQQTMTNFVVINQVSRKALTSSDMAWLNAGYRLIADAAYHGEHYWLYQRKS